MPVDPATPEMLISALEHAADAIAIYDTYANCLWVNDAQIELLGFSREELVGERAHAMFPIDRQEEVEGMHADALAEAGQGMRMHVDAPNKAGHTVPVETTVTLCPGGPSGRGFFLVITRPT